MLNAGIVWNVVNRPALLAVLAVTFVVAWPVGRLLGRGALGVWFVVVLGAVLAATATTRTPYYSADGVRTYLAGFAGLGLHGFAGLGLHGFAGLGLHGFAGTDERLANIGLFLPLGALAMVLWRRPVLTVAGCALLSFVIEGWQGFIGRGGDPVDVVHNTVGGLLGVGLGYAAVRIRGRAS